MTPAELAALIEESKAVAHAEQEAEYAEFKPYFMSAIELELPKHHKHYSELTEQLRAAVKAAPFQPTWKIPLYSTATTISIPKIVSSLDRLGKPLKRNQYENAQRAVLEWLEETLGEWRAKWFPYGKFSLTLNTYTYSCSVELEIRAEAVSNVVEEWTYGLNTPLLTN